MKIVAKSIINKTEYVASAILAVLFSISDNIRLNDNIDFNFILIVNIMQYYISFTILLLVLRWGLVYLSRVGQNKSIAILKSAFFEKKRIPLLALIIMVCWLPTILMLYPGTLYNDSWGELVQFVRVWQGKGRFDAHHPVFDTIIMGGIIAIPSKLTGEWQIFIFVYVIIQAICSALAFSVCLVYAYEKLSINFWVVFGGLLWLCLIPVYSICTQTVSKDSMHAWIFILFCVAYSECVRTRCDFLIDAKHKCFFVILIALICLTKKLGVYIIIISLVGLIAYYKKYKKYLSLLLLSVLCISFMILPVFRMIVGISAGGKQEIFSVPFQQTARYIKYDYDVTPWEYEILDSVLEVDTLGERYVPNNADPVKGTYQRGKFKDYILYVVVWAKQGIRHPKPYVEALFAMEAGWFSWREYVPLMDMEWHSQLDVEYIPEKVTERNEVSKELASKVSIAYDKLYENKLFGYLFSYGWYAAIIPFFIVFIMLASIDKKMGSWLVIVPALCELIMGCYLAPVSDNAEGVRYLFPIIYCMPLLFFLCIYEKAKEGK